MEAKFMYPLQSCKIIHFVRHGHAMNNVEAQKDRDAVLSPHLFDAPLAELGRRQVENLRKRVIENGVMKRIELVITSPLSRAMETAVGVFGSQNESLVTSSPPIVALELARNRIGLRPANMRRDVSEYESLLYNPFPPLSFLDNIYIYIQMEDEEDKLWKIDVQESEEELLARGTEFMKWLWKRPEKEVAIVSHGMMLRHVLYGLAGDSHVPTGHDLCKRFDNCEIRTVVVIHKRLVRLRFHDGLIPRRET
ncbi:PREDICTED: phosphoglycerate mutase-like protein 1 [Tarenaya hassleriana]|uniref:phosphoglycerate mutase-like protein 1 n=1 Tax=Tarenaya hassleriana TaxID=28532 RepID=UPI0008FD6D84|nr:PREDICTED: phosphoglycerate mutase-like protein 1 [Tarenaya hassleriana]